MPQRAPCPEHHSTPAIAPPVRSRRSLEEAGPDPQSNGLSGDLAGIVNAVITDQNQATQGQGARPDGKPAGLVAATCATFVTSNVTVPLMPGTFAPHASLKP